MRHRIMVILLAAFFLFSTAIAEEAPSASSLRVRMTVGDTVLYATLEDNSASRALMAQLPLTLDFTDYNGTEKIAYPPAELDTADAPGSCDPDEGTLAYYAPWGNLCIFYHDFRFSDGLIPLGHIDEGMDALAGRTDDFTMLMENADDPVAASSTLIIYFSYSGNTRAVAETIQAQTKGDLFPKHLLRAERPTS